MKNRAIALIYLIVQNNDKIYLVDLSMFAANGDVKLKNGVFLFIPMKQHFECTTVSVSVQTFLGFVSVLTCANRPYTRIRQIKMNKEKKQ